MKPFMSIDGLGVVEAIIVILLFQAVGNLLISMFTPFSLPPGVTLTDVDPDTAEERDDRQRIADEKAEREADREREEAR